MNCGVPEADKDPLADDEPVTVSSGQFDEDGNDVRRIPPGLVCSDQDRIVGGENFRFFHPKLSPSKMHSLI